MNKLAALLFLGLTTAASAHTWTVTTVVDSVNPSDGLMSLREAIIAVNANVDSSGRCRGINNIVFGLSSTNAVATHGTTVVPYYKIKINYHDPDYAQLMNLPPVPTPLPPVRCPINLDGYSQPGVEPGWPLIEISGEELPTDFQATPAAVRGEDVERTTELLTLVGRLVRQPIDGDTLVGCRPEDPGCPLRRSANGSRIRGIMFNHAPQTGLQLFGVEHVSVTGNYFGLDATGENPAPNGRRSQDDRLFSLLLNGASENTIGTPEERNYFGVARSHSMMLWPFSAVDGTGPCGPATPANNTCSRFDIGSSDNVIQANYFGLDKGGSRSLGAICILRGADRRFIGEGGCSEGIDKTSAIYTNGGPHIFVNFFPNGVPVLQNPMKRNKIGGHRRGEGNVFAAAWSGVSLRAAETQILGNIFGLDARGIGAGEIAPFFRQGLIIMSDSAGTLVQGNIVANSVNFGNLTSAISPYGFGGGILTLGGPVSPDFTDDLPPNLIRGNYIGANILLRHPGNNLIGLPATNAGGGVTNNWMLPTRIEHNVIAYNGYLGEAPVTARSTTIAGVYYPPRRLVVLGNWMFCNGTVEDGETCGKGMGIDWSASPTPFTPPVVGDGPTLNDPGDFDDGPAKLQNFPMLTSTRRGVTGQLASEPNSRYRIQIFASAKQSAACVPFAATPPADFQVNPICENSGGTSSFLAIQGGILIEDRVVVTDGMGNAEFSVITLPHLLVAATATRLDDDGQPLQTSEFSQAILTGNR